jgi:hypothetical protein
MRHLFAGFAGALVCGAAGALAWTLVEPSWEASATLVISSGAAGKTSIDLAAARALLTTEPVLRRAALRPEAAAAIDRHARPSRLDRFLALAAGATGTDTMSRAVAYLADRADARPGAWPDTIEIVARMPAARDATATATALAEAFAADVNETWAVSRRRDGDRRASRLDRAQRRLDEARERLAALRAADPAPVGVIDPDASRNETAPVAHGRLRRHALEAEARLADAARIYGPRHPELIERRNEAQRARAALDRGAPPGTAAERADPAPAAAGGPDPRAADLAVAEDEAARAQTAYELEAARDNTDRREARVIRPAATPARAAGPSLGAVAFYSALSGLLLAGAAPALAGREGRRAPGRTLTSASGRPRRIPLAHAGRLLPQLKIEHGDEARTVAVTATTADLAAAGAKAIALAALEAGWRPLLVVPEAARPDRDARRRFARLDATLLELRTEPTNAGPLDVARACRGARRDERPIDAHRAYDIVLRVVGNGPCAAAADCEFEVEARRSIFRGTNLAVHSARTARA